MWFLQQSSVSPWACGCTSHLPGALLGLLHNKPTRNHITSWFKIRDRIKKMREECLPHILVSVTPLSTSLLTSQMTLIVHHPVPTNLAPFWNVGVQLLRQSGVETWPKKHTLIGWRRRNVDHKMEVQRCVCYSVSRRPLPQPNLVQPVGQAWLLRDYS